ncbi:MAG: phosphatase PAP2 family protein [Candidatus Moranbacteria bacterium]|nr:phosphatase PAP2 family protein [Candidatus Moranbacteria bacterium]MDZ4385568.1 phosphatase PAP2 family protein [Candidatus Moranbacteria bacterium]
MGLDIVKFFNRWGRGTAVDRVTDFVSRMLYLAVFWTLTTIAVFFFAENGKTIAITMTVAASLHFAITEGIFKRLLWKYFNKIRPYIAYPDRIFPIGRMHSDSSFPSSHMSANLAPLSVIVFYYPVIWPIAAVWTLLIAYARLHNGMHYLSDVIAGAILGIAYGALAIYLVNFFNQYVLS